LLEYPAVDPTPGPTDSQQPPIEGNNKGRNNKIIKVVKECNNKIKVVKDMGIYICRCMAQPIPTDSQQPSFEKKTYD
jgi:hypothetical protein